MNKVEHAICRIRERLPQQDNFVTLGVGCVVKHEALAASLGWKCPNLLVTSVDVLSPQQLSSDRTFTAEFLVFEKKGLEVFELKPAAEFCITISGRNLNEQDGSHPNEQLTVLSVEPLDKRGFLKRMVKKSSLQTTRPIDCFDFHNYDNEIDDGLFCNVIREFGSIGQEFESRTYKFKFSKSRNVYLLEDFLHRDIELEEQSFPSDQILAGGVVFSKQGLYLGCLAFYAGQIVPSFIPDTYFQLQEEEAPKEQQGGNEAEGIDADSRKDDEIDENENRELAEENIKEQAYSKETLCEDETPSVHPSIDQLEMHRNDEVGSSDDKEVIEIENMENENVENTSQEEIQEPDKNSEATELGYFKSRRDSTELEFVVSVENAENEESENVNEKAPGSISEMEDNSVKNETKVDDTSEQNDNQEKISSEMEDKEADEEITQNETKPDSEDTNEQEQTNVGQDTLMDNMLHKENDISILQTDPVEDNVVNEHNDVTMETDTEIKNEEDSVLDNTTEKSVEVEETEKNPVSNDCPGIDIAGTDVNTDMERSELNQQTEVESEDQRTTSDIPTSMQEDIPVDNKLTEEISPEDDETSENKEVEVEVEILSPQTTNTDETQRPNLKDENTLDKNQVSSEDSHTDEISELSSSNLEIHQQSEDRELSSHQDEILVNQEEIMSVDGEKQAETQNEVKRDVIELDKPVKPDVIELDKPVKPEEAGEPLEPDDLLTIKITNNPKALDDLAILLDTEHQHGGVSSWYDLAELLAIPKEAYNHCISFSKPSPTEDLLVFLSSTKPQFSISDLKDSLRSISRPDVVHIVDRYIARAVISDGTVIQGVIEREDIDLLGELALKLDRGHHSNWKVLARQLEVPSRIFRNFGSHQRQNSALLMLKYLPIFDPDLTVDSLKDSCRTVGLDDLVKFLDASGVPGDDAIMDILEDTDFIGEITDILNEEDENGPNWKRLGRELKIPEEKFSIFEPSSMNSPTKMLLQSIAKCEPDITVDELILALVAMKRHDIIEMLGKHFRNSDIRSILEENNCLPPQPEDSIKEEEEEESTA